MIQPPSGESKNATRWALSCGKLGPCVHGEVAVKLFRGRPDQGKLDVAAVSGNERREGSEAAFQFVKESCWG